MRFLFVTWDGPEQNYMESLFMPIFAAARDVWQEQGRGPMTVGNVQFMWGPRSLRDSIDAAARRLSMSYAARPILRARPLQASAAATIAYGAAELARLVMRQRVDVVMPRALFASAIVLLAKRLVPDGAFPAICMDADGLQADERIEFAGWSERGATYRLLRGVEAATLREAASAITRTEKARLVLMQRAGLAETDERIHVVPNGKDETLFQPGDEASRAAVRQAHGVPAGVPWLLYVGSLGPQYYPREMFELFREVRQLAPQARFTLLTGQAEQVPELMAAAGLSEAEREAVQAQRVPPAEVPRWMAAADLGVALRQGSFSQGAVSPIKVGEYLLCGLPVVATSGVGDLDTQVAAPHTGKLLPSVDRESLAEAARWFVEEMLPRREVYRDGARRQGEAVFGLRACGERYVAALAAAAASR